MSRCINFLALIFATGFTATAVAQNLVGAGSTFAAPMYTAVTEKFGMKNQFNLSYASVGSGEGIKRIQSRTVDFGASDRPMNRNDLAAKGLQQFPTAIGGIVISVNLPGVNASQIRLDGKVLADIYLGKITRWDDSRLKADNATITFPATPIKLIVREEGSGSSYLISSYLSTVSAAWKEAFGVSSKISPNGATVAKGNAGVAQSLASQSGSIGYIEYGYAIDNKLPAVQLKNAFGAFVTPSADTVSAAVRAADWELLYIDTNPTFEINTINVACPSCWPVVGLTYVVVSKKWPDAEKGAAFTRFMESLLGDGDGILKEKNYVPLPSRAKSLIRVTLKNQLQDAKGNRLRTAADHLPDDSIIVTAQN